MSVTYRRKQVTGNNRNHVQPTFFSWFHWDNQKPVETKCDFVVHPLSPLFPLSSYPVMDSSRKLQNPRCWHQALFSGPFGWTCDLYPSAQSILA